MAHLKYASTAFLCFVCASGQANAQGGPLKGLQSVMGGGLPNISSIGAGNAAGLLGYCVKNKFLSGSSANSVVNGLLKKPGVASSSGYSAGQAGQILNGKAPAMSMSQVPAQLKSQACNMVLKKGGSFL